MGVLASTDIVVKGLPANRLTILDVLVNHGWTFDDSGSISFLPVGDKDQFNWKSVPLTELATVRRELEEKVKLSELIGVCLTWRDTGVGGQLLLDLGSGSLGFVWNINRRRRSDSDRYTDFPWYEEKVVQALNGANIEVVTVKSEDIE